MTNDPQWYEAMGRAMKRRDHALSMLKRWGEALGAAEDEIQALSNNTTTNSEPVSAPEE